MDGFVKELSGAYGKYDAVYDILKDQRLVSEGKSSIFQVDLQQGSTYLSLVSGAMNMYAFNNLASVLQPVSMLNTFGIKLPATLVKPIQEKVAALHQTKTTDTNIPHDNEWDFHTVNFHANGGTVQQKSATTVEDGRIAGLPQPEERAGYTFVGWYTEPEGGKSVSAEDDLSAVNTLYAHWTYTGKPEEEKSQPAASVPVTAQQTAGTGVRKKAAANLHIRFFGSVPAAHEQIRAAVADDLAFRTFCEQFASRLTRNQEGIFEVDLGSWLLLDAGAVQALQACGSDVALNFTLQEERFRILLPAGFDLSFLAGEDGSVCVLCLAEALGA